MDKVPEIISTKDLDYISDMFNWNFTASKKCNHFISEVDDEQIKDMITKVRDMHSKHCQKLITILGGNNE